MKCTGRMGDITLGNGLLTKRTGTESLDGSMENGMWGCMPKIKNMDQGKLSLELENMWKAALEITNL